MLDAFSVHFTNSFSTFATIKKAFFSFFRSRCLHCEACILSIFFYARCLHKIIKKCVFGEMKKKEESSGESMANFAAGLLSFHTLLWLGWIKCRQDSREDRFKSLRDELFTPSMHLTSTAASKTRQKVNKNFVVCWILRKGNEK